MAIIVNCGGNSLLHESIIRSDILHQCRRKVLLFLLNIPAEHDLTYIVVSILVFKQDREKRRVENHKG